jgi:hypothetical protein
MKYALVCVNENSRVVSVELFADKDEARNEMLSQFERERQDAEECGFETDHYIDDCYATLSYGSSSSAWEIKPTDF